MSESLFAAYGPRDPGRLGGARRSSAVRVRAAAAGDVPDIARIIQQREGGVVEDHAGRLETQLDESKSGQITTAMLADRIVGYGRVVHFTPRVDAPANAAPEGWYLAGLVVRPEHRRQGVGHALTAYRLAWLSRRAREAFYFANARNQVTVDLHRNFGFTEVTRDFVFPGVSFSGAGVGILFCASLGGAESGGVA